MSERRIYLSPPHMGPAERELLLEAFDSNWISTVGPQVTAFEREFADAVQTGHAAALSSGSAGLHLALILLGVGPGDDVLCSDLTFAATANAVVYQGARPVFIDSDRSTWNLDPDLLAEELDQRRRAGNLPRAVITVDLYGQCADYDRILPICAEHDVPVVEDAAEALGADYRGKPAGNFGALAVFSFNGNKIITTSGGGMLTSTRQDWIDRARNLSAQAREPVPHYEHTAIGYNYRLSNLLAAIGRAQLARLPERVARRRAVNATYRAALADQDGIEFMPEADYGRSNCWLTCLTVDAARFGASSETIRQHLESKNIEARNVWKPMHLQPVFRALPIRGGSVSDDLFARGLCLPSGSNLTDADLDRIISAIRSTPRA
jgi:dTDP-4-amino-4,6-dideoxygalactose transaminase